MRSLLLFAILEIVLAATAAPASAAPALVLLFRPPRTSNTIAQTLTLVHGELVADGFQVTDLELDSIPDRAAMQGLAMTRPDAVALIGLFETTEGRGAELRVVDRATGKIEVRPVEAMGEGSNAGPDKSASPAILARHAVEVLRATLLELSIVPSSEPAPTTAPIVVPAETKPIDRAPDPFFGLEGGMALLSGFDRVGPALMPVARLRIAPSNLLMTRLSLTGFGTRPGVETAAGTATIGQALVLVEVAAWLMPSRSLVRPLLSMGAGAYHIDVRANANPPNVAARRQQWTWAANAGAGIGFRLGSHWTLMVETYAVVVAPYPVVRFLGSEVARTGRPSFLGLVTLAGSP